MTASWLGMDVGGSKIQVRIEDQSGDLLLDQQWPTGPWSGETYDRKAVRMAELITLACSLAKLTSPPVAIGIGAHGCDTPEECAAMTALMAQRMPGSVFQVVNDAALVALCAPGHHAAGLIAGTGAVAVARTADGGWLQTGGWGWVVGDEGGASGLVRAAIGEVLLDWDRGHADDLLTQALVKAFRVTHLLDLPSQLLRLPASDWSRHASLIFDCLREGSPLARQVIDSAVASLTAMILRLRQRNAHFEQVIAAGGVISHQPLLFEQLASALRQQDATLTLSLLQGEPVSGALALARQVTPASNPSLLPRGE
ncbi:N-acetylglucosamine kinase [Biostraticola tofi]|uniref:N-acetylglucosamine kinase-like BadF-type ATPase n=1 Tax=Biostraticola tofi TaxID=466109 RepID=A0A4R3Z341_9GAMM|nr:BadF/BadG/BcrA/BcrD ATPase family protein [Biostraticola tofi]TCV99677.1 N-acetylglucosamine kinase-like BadF-type ATPase [Biostraticola tofi]